MVAFSQLVYSGLWILPAYRLSYSSTIATPPELTTSIPQEIGSTVKLWAIIRPGEGVEKGSVLYLSLGKYCSARDAKFMDSERDRFRNFMASENSPVKEGNDKHFHSKLFILCFQCPLSVKFPTSFRSSTPQPLTLPDQHWLLEYSLSSSTLAPIGPFCWAAQQGTPARLGLSEQREGRGR